MLRLRVLVTGSRTWDDASLITDKLAELVTDRQPANTITVVHGDARGADRIAAEAAVSLGMNISAYPANWSQFGKAAGHIRNVAMLATNPDLCLAFIKDNSPGASHCAGLAEARGVPTRRYTQTTRVTA